MPSKICTQCHKQKDVLDFYKTSSGRGYFGTQSKCKACMNTQSVLRTKIWRIENPGRRDISDKKYRENNREKCVAACVLSARKKKEYYNMRALNWRHANPELTKKINKSYRNRNPEKVRIWNNNRRSAKKQAQGSFTLNEWQENKEMYNNLCVYCGKPSKILTIDHIVPLSKGGSNRIENIVPACRTCNSAKNDDSLLVFLRRRLAN